MACISTQASSRGQLRPIARSDIWRFYSEILAKSVNGFFVPPPPSTMLISIATLLILPWIDAVDDDFVDPGPSAP
ncbi:hypothetical protein GGR55DRAFT_683667 [Xylaria sp. FL0064]|nr:hypothetical protein GGR55DRAFT_683667 [Xylaria sp. FL0064]